MTVHHEIDISTWFSAAEFFSRQFFWRSESTLDHLLFEDMASFSLERPFGVYLWDYFSQTYELIVGKPAETFSFVQGLTPLSTNNEGILTA
jgi:hypothetical protein